MKTVNKSFTIGGNQIITKSDNDSGELLDTIVYINEKAFCVIAGNTITNFIEDLKYLYEKYHI